MDKKKLQAILFILLAASAFNCTLDESNDRIKTELDPLYPETELKGWELDETNTGLKQDYSGLTDFDAAGADASSGYLPEWGTLTLYAGATVTDRIISNELNLEAGGITLRRCLIRPVSVGMGMPLIVAGNAVLQDCEIDGSLIPDANIVYSIAFSGTGIIERCDIHDAATGIFINNNSRKISVAQGNYIHDLRWISPAHMDGMTIRGSSGAGLIMRNNRSICGSSEGSTGALFIQPYSSYIDNVLIKGNLLEGYGYTLSLEDRGYGYGENMRAINNRFNPYPGSWGPVAVDGGPGWYEWTDNYRYDSSAEDGRGDKIVQ